MTYKVSSGTLNLCSLTHNCDFVLNPLTLNLEDDLDILKMYPHTENEAASKGKSEVRCYLDLGPMTLKLNCDLGILKIYLHSPNRK